MRPRTLVTTAALLAVFLCGRSLAAKPRGVESAPDRSSSEAAQKLVTAALAAAAEGQVESRDALLGQALEADPDCAAAHWHRGDVRCGGRWLSIDEVAKQTVEQGKIFEYNNRRLSADMSAAGQLALARWCRQQGLSEQHRAHALLAVAADPTRPEARLELGLRPYRGLWLSPAEIGELEQRLARDDVAFKRWRTQLGRWQKDLSSKRDEVREAAEEKIRALADPSAIPAIERVLSMNSCESAILAVAAVANMPEQAATESLVRHAVLSPWHEVRQSAAEALRPRSLYSYAPLLLAGLEAPVEAQFAFVQEGFGSWRYRCMLYREGPMADTAMDLQVRIRPEFQPRERPAPNTLESTVVQVPNNEAGLAASKQLASQHFGVSDESLQLVNQRARQINARIGFVLMVAANAPAAGSAGKAKSPQPEDKLAAANKSDTDEAEADDSQADSSNVDSSNVDSETLAEAKPDEVVAEEAATEKPAAEADDKANSLADAGHPRHWWSWWFDYNDIYYTGERPVADSFYQYQGTYQPVVETTRYEPKPVPTGPTPQPRTTPQDRRLVGNVWVTSECFVGETPVWTPTGAVRIDRVRPGDLVLAQHPETGELTYKAVLATTVRPPTQLLRIETGSGDLVATRGHPLWVSGKGWRMARELAVGDLLHTATGPRAITRIEPAPKAAAYNLVVDGFNNYFAGADRVLSHDNNLRQPTDAIVPGLVASK